MHYIYFFIVWLLSMVISTFFLTHVTAGYDVGIKMTRKLDQDGFLKANEAKKITRKYIIAIAFWTIIFLLGAYTAHRLDYGWAWWIGFAWPIVFGGKKHGATLESVTEYIETNQASFKDEASVTDFKRLIELSFQPKSKT